jgi:hypothetical protein
VRPALALRVLLEELTDALARAEHHDEVIVDAASHVAWVDSTLDDVDLRDRLRAPNGLVVLRPDGLWEWAVRRDFVRGLGRGSAGKRRLAATLAGPKTRRRFEVALSTEPLLERAFDLHRRRRLRAWAARVLRMHAAPAPLRHALAALVATARSAAAEASRAAADIPELTPRQRARKQKRRARQMRRNRAR